MLQCRFLTIRIFWPSEFCKISPQRPRDGISESLDSKIFALAYHALDPLENSCIYGAQLVPLALPLGGPSKILNRGPLDITLRHWHRQGLTTEIIGNFSSLDSLRLRNLVRLRDFSVKYLLLQTFYRPFFCIPHLYSNSCGKPRTIISF
jgi:hypothetical protein